VVAQPSAQTALDRPEGRPYTLAHVAQVREHKWFTIQRLIAERPWTVMLRKLLSLFAASAEGYRAYTTQFDLEVNATDLAKSLGLGDETAFRDYAFEFDRALARWQGAANIVAVESAPQVKSTVGAACLKDTVASLLIDHSGSMKGQRAMIVTAMAEIIADYWSRLGISYEILGFTTRSWKGGLSRKKWLRAGRPANPGRLCDLLHIIYRSADDPNPGAPWSIRNLLRPELLRENIDGEALLWAARRLRQRTERRKLLVVVSDGAPADDSTLSANDDAAILERHVQEVSASIAAAGDIRLAGIGIDHDLSHLYCPENIAIHGPDDIGSKVLPFLATLLSDPPATAGSAP
jgi:cobaltochelatase CobT